MSDVNDSTSGTQDAGDAGSSQDLANQNQDVNLESVQAELEALKKSNADQFKELKTFKKKASDLETEKNNAYEAKLKEEGNSKELLEIAEAKADAIAKKFKSKVMDEQLKNAALKAGCNDVDAFMKLAGDYSTRVKFNEDHDAEAESLNEFIGSMKTNFSGLNLFKTDTKPPADGGHGGTKTAPLTFAQAAAEKFNSMR